MRPLWDGYLQIMNPQGEYFINRTGKALKCRHQKACLMESFRIVVPVETIRWQDYRHPRLKLVFRELIDLPVKRTSNVLSGWQD